jgi:hypothetical protein
LADIGVLSAEVEQPLHDVLLPRSAEEVEMQAGR